MNNTNTLSIFQITEYVLKRKIYLLIIISFFAIASLIYSGGIEETYKSEITLYHSEDFESQGSDMQGLPSFIGLNFDTSSSAVKHMAILESKAFLISFIQKNNLLSLIFSNEWDNVNNKWINKQPSVIDAYSKFIQDFLFIEENKANGLITISIITNNPETSSFLANKIVADANNFIRLQDLENIEKNMNFLNQKLLENNNEISQNYISQMLQSQTTRLMKANVNKDYAFTIIDPALTPLKKYAPSRLKILISSIFMGLVICMFFLISQAFIDEYRNYKKDSSE